jgi:hypothetical protein
MGCRVTISRASLFSLPESLDQPLDFRRHSLEVMIERSLLDGTTDRSYRLEAIRTCEAFDTMADGSYKSSILGGDCGLQYRHVLPSVANELGPQRLYSILLKFLTP